MDKLNQARININQIDEKMASLFIQRMHEVKQVILYKIENNLPIFNEQRELEVIERNLMFISDENLKPYYAIFIQDVMNCSKKYQQQFLSENKIGYQGTKGAFSYNALLQYNKDAEAIAYPEFKDAVDAVLKHEVSSAILPIENSYTGDVGEVLDLLYHNDIYISDVLNLAIDQNLLAISNTKIQDIKKVYSHPQALAQCKTFFLGRDIELIPFANTALAAKYVHEKNDPTIAAIASATTASLYDLNVLVEHIQSASDNTTKFIVLKSALPTKGNRVSCVFSVKHESGQLSKILNHIGEKGFNLESIKSRALHDTAWKYYFYMEIDGDFQQDSIKQLINDLKLLTEHFKVIGVYTI